MKTYLCYKCRETLPASDFHKMNSHKSRKVQGWCKNCMKAYYAPGTKEHTRRKDYMLTYRFGLSKDEYEELLGQQNYQCAICDIDIENCSRDFAVDHDHSTGKVRGLLCSSCNTGLGQFKDSIVNLQSAIRYLKEHSND